jgi:hypothetical protein
MLKLFLIFQRFFSRKDQISTQKISHGLKNPKGSDGHFETQKWTGTPTNRQIQNSFWMENVDGMF